jgi:hypothetical protein
MNARVNLHIVGQFDTFLAPGLRRQGCALARRGRPALPAPRGGWWGAVALSRCAAAHPLDTGIAKIFGASIAEAVMRPNPRCWWTPRGTTSPWRR